MNRCNEDENLNLLTEKDGTGHPGRMASNEVKRNDQPGRMASNEEKRNDQPGRMASSVAERNDQPPLPVRFTKIENAWLKALLEEPDR